jgi:hypothetical protein
MAAATLFDNARADAAGTEAPKPERKPDFSKRQPYRDQGLIDFLRTQTENSFARSLVRHFESKGSLTERQTNAALKLKGEVESGSPPPSSAARPNLYAGPCDRCGNEVAAKAGVLVGRAGAWKARHLEGQCPPPLPRGANRKQVAEQQSRVAEHETARAQIKATVEVPDGKYTVVFGDGERRTLKLKTQDDDASYRPGVRLLSFLSGPDNYTNYTSFGEMDSGGNVVVWKKFREAETVIEAAKVLVADPRAALAAYGMESGHCGMCGRELTVPESIANGIGPVCMAKAGW